MSKKGLVLGTIVTALFLGGCGDGSSPTPFDQSIQRVDAKYTPDAVTDGKFLDEIDASGKKTHRFTDEERIKYGKAICTLLDETGDTEAESYDEEELAISTSAINNYCPHHLK